MKMLFLLIGMSLFLLPTFVSALTLNLTYPKFGLFDINVNQNLFELIGYVYYFMVGIAGLVAFIMLVWGGVQWLLSGAMPAQASEARDKVRNAIMGLLLILSSFLIVQIINPELTIINQRALQQFLGETPALGTGSLPVDLKARDKDVALGSEAEPPIIFDPANPATNDFPSFFLALDWTSPAGTSSCDGSGGWPVGSVDVFDIPDLPPNGTEEIFLAGAPPGTYTFSITCFDAAGAQVGAPDSVNLEVI